MRFDEGFDGMDVIEEIEAAEDAERWAALYNGLTEKDRRAIVRIWEHAHRIPHLEERILREQERQRIAARNADRSHGCW